MVVDLNVCTRGAGHPVVLGHGLGDTAATWAPLAGALLADGRWAVTTWELRAHGGAATPDDANAYSRDLALADLASVAELARAASAAGEAPVIVGHSLGGYLALALAITRPELVRALVLIATGPGFRDPKARDEWNRYVHDTVPAMDIRPEAAALCEQPDSMVIDRVGEIEVPVLQLVGEKDTRFHAGVAYLDRVLPDVTTEHIGGAGHHPQVRHADAVNTAVLAFLDRVS